MDVASLEIRIRTLESELGVRRLRSDLTKLEGGALAAGKTGSAAMGGMAAAATKLRTIIGATLGLVGFAGLSLAIKKATTDGIKFNSFVEQQTISFKTLLGSMDKAKQRMAELEVFAARTPFDLPGVVAMSRQLQALTDGTMATEEGLRLVGGAAAAVSADLESATTWMARLFTSLEGGEPFGLSIRMLKMMGLVTTEMGNELEKLSGKALGASGAMEVMRKTFGRFSTAMEEQSRTFGGMMETFKDGIQIMLGAATMPLFTRLKVQLQGLADYDWRTLGTKIGAAVEVGFQEFAGGRGPEFIGLVIEAGFEQGRKGVDKLMEYWQKVFEKVSFTGIFLRLSMVFVKHLSLGLADAVGLLGKGVVTIAEVLGNSIEAMMNRVIAFMNKYLLRPGVVGISPFSGNQSANADAMRNQIDAGTGALKGSIGGFFDRGIAAGDAYFGAGSGEVGDSASSKLVSMAKAQFDRQKALDAAAAATKALYTPWEVNKDKTAEATETDRKMYDKFNLISSSFKSLQAQFEKARDTMADSEWLSDATVEQVQEKADEIAAIGDELQRRLTTNAVSVHEAWTFGFRMAVDSFGSFSERVSEVGSELAKSMDQNITDGFMGIIDGTQSVQEAFANMANSIIQDLIRVMIQQLVVRSILRGLGGLGGIFGGGASNGDWLGEAGTADTMHSGGVVGASRYPMGGVAGDEVPIIAHRGEVIFNEEQFGGLMKGMSSGKGQRVEIINVTDPSMIDEHLARNPGAVLNVIARNRGQIKAALGIRG